jgi:hypothetical protein
MVDLLAPLLINKQVGGGQGPFVFERLVGSHVHARQTVFRREGDETRAPGVEEGIGSVVGKAGGCSR